MTADELFELHPLPWTHHLLLVKDANNRQVIHTGGLYDDRSRLHQGEYLSGLNALLVECANSRSNVTSDSARLAAEARNRDKAQEIVLATEAAIGGKFSGLARHELADRITAALNAAAAPADNDTESLLQHVAYSGVEFDDNRMGYVVVQIDRDVWEQIQKLAPTTKGDR